MRHQWKNIVWFTLTELVVSIVISVMILWGIFFFLSETLLWLARNSAQSDFLKSFYTFSSVFESGEFEILSDEGYHIGLLESPGTWEGIIVWVLDITTLRLISVADTHNYLPAVMWYRAVSSDEISNIRSDINYAYSLDFQRDRVFDNFFIYSFEIYPYNQIIENAWEPEESSHYSIHELELVIFPQYYPSLRNTPKSQISFDDLLTYSLVF